jgi:hypothetical protein
VLGLRAAGAAGALQRRARAWLARQQDRDGGWNYESRGSTSDPDDTGAVLEALAGARGRPAGRARRRGVAYLARLQDRDGGFASVPGTGANTQSTAWVIQGLDACRGTSAARGAAPVRRRALAYLRRMQLPDGAIRYSSGSTQTPVWVTAEALMALEGRPLPLS